MDLTALHKSIVKREESKENRDEKKIKRRSFAQKQLRGLVVAKQRNFSPLKEWNRQTFTEKRIARKERLKVWKEQQRKKKELKEQNAKPVFKVSAVVKRDDYKLLEIRKENEIEAPARNTRSRKKLADVRKEAKKPSRKVAKKTTKVEESRVTNKAKLPKDGNKEQDEKLDPGSTSTVSEDGRSTGKEEQDNKKPESSGLALDAPPLSESFAPNKFQFKPPTGLKRYQFDANLPNSNESFASNGRAMNFISSTPCVPNAVTRSKTPIPMVISSASASSSDENSKPATVDKKETSSRTPGRERKSGEHSRSFEVLSQDMEKAEKVEYFRSLIKTETESLTSSCTKWEGIQDQEREALVEDVVGEIRTVIGQAQLLMAERFTQFGGLIDKYEAPKPDHNPVTPQDLKGFWEMIYFQVEDVAKKFKNLDNLKEKNWSKVVESKQPLSKKRKTNSKAAKPSSASRRAAKQRLKQAKEAMRLRKAQRLEEESDKPCEDAATEEANTGGQPEKALPSLDRGMMTRSKVKTPKKNISFASPRSKKRKARFAVDEIKDDLESTPTGSLPRRRVMRKTPLPRSKSGSVSKAREIEEELSGCNDDEQDVQASPTLKKQHVSPLADSEVFNQPDEIRGKKLNFDEVESDVEEDSLIAKYLVPSAPDIGNARLSIIGLPEKYLLPPTSDSPANNVSDQLLAKSLGRVLRSSRKSCHNPMSPFLHKNKDSGATSGAEDLMSFSPLPTK